MRYWSTLVFRSLAAAAAVGAAACASAPRPAGLQGAAGGGPAGSELLDCVQKVSGELGYIPPIQPSKARFRRVDADGQDALWYTAATSQSPISRIVLIAETWLDSSGQPALFVTAYETSARGIIAVEPGPETNKRLGARFHGAANAVPAVLTRDILQDLRDIRASCPAPAS